MISVDWRRLSSIRGALRGTWFVVCPYGHITPSIAEDGRLDCWNVGE